MATTEEEDRHRAPLLEYDSPLAGASSRCGEESEDSMMHDLDRILVVDADGHVNEGDADLAPRLPGWERAERPTAAATP